MKFYQLSHLADAAVRQGLQTIKDQEARATAKLVAFLAEFDARKLYLRDGYPSLRSYCVKVLSLSDDAACRRIQAARAAREFPVIFEALADRRLHLTGVNVLAPYLTQANVKDFLGGAEHKTKAEIEILIAERFPRSEEMALVEKIPAGIPARACDSVGSGLRVTAPSCQPALARVPSTESHVRAIAPDRFALHLSVSRELQEKLRHAQDLLGHTIPSGNIEQVLSLALDALIGRLEKRKFAATGKPRQASRPTSNPRTIPAQVRRAVWERDEGRCTFVGEGGHRCASRRRLEFDHIREFARGGEATAENIRLRCRAHNQYGAELTYGAGFMQDKRHEARCEAQAARDKARRERVEEVIPWLRALGCRLDEARRAAERCAGIPDAPLEERVRLAVSHLGPRPQPPPAPRHLSQ